MRIIALTCFFIISSMVSTNAQQKTKTKIVTEVKHGKVVTEKLASKILKENKLGIATNRSIKIYLPPSYETSTKRYPVVYYFHSMFGNAEMILGEDHVVQLIEKAFTSNIINEFIFVVPDYSTAAVGSLYENSPVSGRWLDYTTEELVPFIDSKFRTIAKKESRAVVGDFMGGRGALKFAMTRADLFSVVYAMHPVATGTGYLPWRELGIDWKRVLNTKSMDELKDLPHDSRVKIFIAICQAFLPNPNKPPFYCDFFMEMKDGKPQVNVENMAKVKKGFHLEESVRESASNLQKLRGIALDWARYDGNYDHIQSARVLSRELDDVGIEHDAEEYRGNPWNKVWTSDGRFYTRVLPFVSKNLAFD